MKYAGQITEWNDEGGFGFIVPNGGGDRAFVHISQFKTKARRPSTGDLVTYSLSEDSRGRLQARAIDYARQETQDGRKKSTLPGIAIGFGALVAVGVAFLAGLFPPLIAGTYLALSGLSFLMYMKDKSAARKNAWRTPEQTLHLLDLLGGWPGGLIAQQQFYHKTIKQPFQFIFWLSVIANIGGVWWLITTGTAEQLSRSVIG